MGSDQQDKFPDADVLLNDNIQTIAQSPFGKTHAGAQIVQILDHLRMKGNILFVKLDGRGEEIGDEAHINEDFYKNKCKTVSELVHEGSHLFWRSLHKGRSDSFNDLVEDELQCQLNQLEIYQWMKDTKKYCPEDSILEDRLKYVDAGLSGKHKYDRLRTRIANSLKD